MFREELKLRSCCFFGHRKIAADDELLNVLRNTVEGLITNKNVDTFLFGSKSEFDDLCHKVVTELKGKYPCIKRIYVRAEFPYIDDNYKAYLLQNYEDTYYPGRMINAGKASYVERNYEMIDNCKFCVIYYDENYTPERRKSSRKNLVSYQPKSGTKIAYDYVKQKGLHVTNVFPNNK